jgi:two-component system, OmpR family, response regulator
MSSSLSNPKMAAPVRKLVLVVEDDPALRKLIQAYLKALDFDSIGHADGRAAMNELAKSEFDLVCMDLMLPEVSGYDLCEHIRKTLGLTHLPILIISARTLPEDRAYAEEVGATAYLAKPFSRSDFAKQIRHLFEVTSPHIRGLV